MQKLIAILLSILAIGIAHAESQIKIENGWIVIYSTTPTLTGVRVSSEAQEYPYTVEKAFNEPGKPVTVKETTRTVVDLFHWRDVTQEFGVKYDVQNRLIDLVPNYEAAKTEITFFPFPLFWLFSVVAFLVYTKKPKTGIIVITSIVTGITAFFAGSAITAASLAGMFLATIAATIPLIIHIDKKMKEYKGRTSIAFYVLMVLSASITYYPLF